MRIEEYFQQIEATLALFPYVALKTMRYDQRSETNGFMTLANVHVNLRVSLHFL